MKDAMKQKREDLGKLLKELKTFQDSLAEGKTPDQATADAMDAKAAEAESLQAEIEKHDKLVRRLSDAQGKGSKLVDPVLPEDDHDTKGGQPGRPDDLVGYMTPGDFVIAQGTLQKLVDNGMAKGVHYPLAKVPRLLRKRGEKMPLVPVSRKQVEVFRETKAVPVIGDQVIAPDRQTDFVRVDEHDELVLRDVLNVLPTSSDTVYYTRLVSYTRAADRVAHGAQKPEAAMVLDNVSGTVDTIAAQIPVQNQQLADYPALAGLINGELLYDLDKRVEELVMWNDPAVDGGNFTGLAVDDDIQAMRNVGGDTLVDIIRRGITDVRRDGYRPNAVLMDPLDWEGVVLLKGTDNHYVWVVITDGQTSRLWSLPVVETVACEDTMDTGARTVIVGDFRVGATLWDRMQAEIQVGWINDQFIRNMRTILAELRAAWGIKRPNAFRRHETSAGTS